MEVRLLISSVRSLLVFAFSSVRSLARRAFCVRRREICSQPMLRYVVVPLRWRYHSRAVWLFLRTALQERGAHGQSR